MRFALLSLGPLLVWACAGPARAGETPGTPTFEKDDRSFFVPRAFSPIRMVRLKFHPEEPKLFGQVSDRRLAVWDLTTAPGKSKAQKNPKVAPEMICPHAQGWIEGFDVHPSGRWLATAGSDRQLKLWAWKDGKAAEQPAADVRGHEGWIQAVAFSPDGSLLATAASDLKVKVWDSGSLKLLHTWSGPTRYPHDLVWSSDGKFLIVGDEAGAIHIWSWDSKKLTRTIEFGNVNDQTGQYPPHSGVHRLACSPEGAWLAAIGNSRFSLYHLTTGRLVAADNLEFDAVFHPSAPILFAGSMAFRFDAAQLEKQNLDTGGKSATASVPPGKALRLFPRDSGGYGAAFSRDGARLALTTGESTVGLWTVKE